MTQEDPYTYGVKQGEDVRFEITPMNGAAGERATAAVDGNALENTGSKEVPVFLFKVTKNSGERHFAILAFSFVDGDPNDAHYKIKVSGSEGGDYDSNPVWKEDGDLQEPEYTFKVS
ncbi:MAG: hypothetical protein JSW64_13515 [Candidatus Zixiibacteriota bacterium]|nr:MAG: hypothetical protein JSW64_13515 [candidate division Zixibacteria bacterium]